MSTDIQHFEIVDPHVHLWDLSHHGAWYPSLTGKPRAGEDGGLGDTSGLRRDYLLPQYEADAQNYRVSKLVHVTATQASGSYRDETRWLEGMKAECGRPHALIAAIDPGLSLPEISRELDALQACDSLRGIRVVFGLDPGASATRELLRMLSERGLIFELVAHPHNALEFARLLEKLPDLRVVLEHMGWPTAPNEAGHFVQWQTGMRALAGLGTVACKLSGLAMALHEISEARMRPWIEAAIEDFGIDRCCFASNFPVDGLYGSFNDLYTVYRSISAGLGAAAERQLFVTNAERIYLI